MRYDQINKILLNIPVVTGTAYKRLISVALELLLQMVHCHGEKKVRRIRAENANGPGRVPAVTMECGSSISCSRPMAVTVSGRPGIITVESRRVGKDVETKIDVPEGIEVV